MCTLKAYRTQLFLQCNKREGSDAQGHAARRTAEWFMRKLPWHAQVKADLTPETPSRVGVQFKQVPTALLVLHRTATSNLLGSALALPQAPVGPSACEQSRVCEG
jgi:hypothetical protein